MSVPARRNGVYAVVDRILRGALGATLLFTLAGCSEQVSSSIACPELCTDESATLRDTLLVGSVVLDTTFSGFPLHRPTAARAHWWLANIGLAAMASAFALRVHAPAAGTILLAAGGSLSAAGAYLFVYLIWRTIDGPAHLRAGAHRARSAMDNRRPGRQPLPLATSSRGTPPAA